MNSELLYITRKLGYPSSFGTRAGLGDFLEQYPDGIYAENGGGAPIGWESAAVWFGGDSERAAARFERMMSERNELSRLFRTRVSGVLVLTFIYRLKSRMVTAIPIVGAQPAIDPQWLYFTLPQGGTVTLTKNGTPTEVTLEYSLDNGSTWTTWVETENVRSLTLAAGQTMHVRNTSETSTRFSTSTANYYNFAFTADTYVGGNTNSLLCKIPSNAVITSYCYCYMFHNCISLTMNDTFTLPSTTLAPSCYYYTFSNCKSLTMSNTFALPATILSSYCYSSMFSGCTNLTMNDSFTLPASILALSCYNRMFNSCVSLTMNNIFILPATTLNDACFAYMFNACTNINLVKTNMTDISAVNCLTNWLLNVSPTGDFYCPAELTIPTGASGIPSGWTRHDI